MDSQNPQHAPILDSAKHTLLPGTKQLLESLAMPVLIFDQTGMLCAANRQSESVSGLSVDLLIGNFNIALDPYSQSIGSTAAFQNALAGQVHNMAPIQLDVRDFVEYAQVEVKKQSWVMPTFAPIRDESGTVTHVMCTYTDITESVEADQRAQAQDQQLRIFAAVVENAPDGIALANMDRRITYANPTYQQTTGYGKNLLGKSLDELYVDGGVKEEQMFADMERHGFHQSEYQLLRADGVTVPVRTSVFLIKDAAGNPVTLAGIERDISAERSAAAERVALQEQVIQAQQDALRELSTPIIPIAAGVVVMPLIGAIDGARAQQVVEVLLNGVAEQRAHTVILDITGVPVVDTAVANGLLRAAQAVKLLGARVTLSGIRPEVAQTLVGLGIDLGGITTRSTLQSAVAQALGR